MEGLLSILGSVVVFGTLMTFLVYGMRALFIRLGTLLNAPGLVAFFS